MHCNGDEETYQSGIGLWHVLITEFSYRGHKGGIRSVDPLDPQRLDFRFKVFELACLPSVLAQTSQEFDWVIIIDKSLSIAHRERLLQSVGSRRRTYLHEFSSTEDLTGSAWLTKYAPKNAQHILTTLLDDDDTLPMSFAEAVQTHIKDGVTRFPRLVTFGYKSSLQWDLIASKRAPLGYRCSWHRGNWTRAAGVSMLCRPEDNLSVMALSHRVADVWFETERADALSRRLLEKWGVMMPPEEVHDLEEAIHRFRLRAQPLVDTVLASKHQQCTDPFVELSSITGPVVMTNHYFNEVVFRLLEPKRDRSRVTGRESFPNTVVRFELLERDSPFFKKRWRMYWQLLNRSAGDRPFGFEHISKARLAIWGLWRFMRT